MIVREAYTSDFSQLAELLNEIIEIGGTTAITNTTSPETLLEYKTHYSGRNYWLVTERKDGLILGFQYLEPHDHLPENAADIATFVRVGFSRRGIGRKMFELSKKKARDLGYAWINATIRCDNESGLAFYRGRGFRTYSKASSIELPDGQIVNRVSTRFDLS